MTSSRLALWLKGLVSAGFFLVLFRVVGGADLLGLFRSAEAGWLAASVALSFVMISASCLKWWLLLRHQQRPVPFVQLLRFYFIGYYFTCLLPSNVGGDLVRSVYAGRWVGSQQQAAVSVLLERATGLVLLLLLVIGCPWLVEGLGSHPAFAAPAAAAAVLLALVVGGVRWRRPLTRGAEWLRRVPVGPRPVAAARAAAGRALERLQSKTRGFHQALITALHDFRRAPLTSTLVLALTVGFYGLACLNVYVSFRAFHAAIEVRSVAAALPTAMMVAMLPVAPLAGLGLAEGAYVYYFGLVGMPASASLAMGLLLRCKLLLLGAIGWLLHLTLPAEGR